MAFILRRRNGAETRTDPVTVRPGGFSEVAVDAPRVQTPAYFVGLELERPWGSRSPTGPDEEKTVEAVSLADLRVTCTAWGRTTW